MRLAELPRNIKYKLLCSFLNRLAAGSIFPFIVIILTEVSNKQVTAVVIFIGVIFQMISSVLGGYMSDRIGRKIILLCGQAVNLLTFFILGLVLLTGMPGYLFIGMYLFNLLFGGVHSGVKEAILLDEATEEQRKTIYTIDYWVFNLTTALGLIIGGLLVEHYAYLLLFFFACTLLITMYIYQFKMTFKFADKNNHSLVQSLLVIIKNKSYIWFMLGTICVFSVEIGFATLMSVFMYNNFSGIQVAGIELTGLNQFVVIQTVNTAIIILLTSSLSTKFRQVKNKQKLYMIAVCINIIGYFLAFLSRNFWIIILLICCVSLAEIIYAPMRQVVQVNLIEPKHKALYFSVSALLLQSGGLLTSLYLYLYDHIGLNYTATVVLIIGGMGLLLTGRYVLE